METILDPNPTKARKTHRCDFCQYLINTGDTYLRSTHVAFGDIYKTERKTQPIAFGVGG